MNLVAHSLVLSITFKFHPLKISVYFVLNLWSCFFVGKNSQTKGKKHENQVALQAVNASLLPSDRYFWRLYDTINISQFTGPFEGIYFRKLVPPRVYCFSNIDP